MDRFKWVHGKTIEMVDPLIRRGLRVLDLGCGRGDLSLYLAEKGCEVVGVDQEPAALRYARLESGSRALTHRARFLRRSVEHLPVELGEFDLVLIVEVLEHLEHPRAALEKVSKMTAPGGRWVISAPLSAAPIHRWRVASFGADYFDEAVGHRRRYTQEELVELVRELNMVVEKTALTEGPLRNFFFSTMMGRLTQPLAAMFWEPLGEPVDNLLMNLLGPSRLILCGRDRNP